MSNFIRQNKVNVADELLKVEQPLLGSSSKINEIPCSPNTKHFPDTTITVFGTRFPSQEF